MNRRQFVQTGAACGLLLLKSRTAFSYQANSAVRLACWAAAIAALLSPPRFPRTRRLKSWHWPTFSRTS